MNLSLQIETVLSPGNKEDERIVIKSLADTEMGEYVLLQTGFNADINKVTVKTYNSFWFPDGEIKNGDFVVIYTKLGQANVKETKKGKVHFFYWNLSFPIWDKSDRAPVLLYAPVWIKENPASYLDKNKI